MKTLLKKFFNFNFTDPWKNTEQLDKQIRLFGIYEKLRSLDKSGYSLTYRNRTVIYDIYSQGILKYSLTKEEFDYIDHFILEDVLKEIK